MTEHDRDRSIEILLRSRSADDAPPMSQDCLDAEMLAAWMEGELPDAARVSAEGHAAGCSRCQALLAAMARTEPASETRPWWRALTAKWLVPIAAIATVVIVWVSVERTRPTPVTATTPPAATPRGEPQAAEMTAGPQPARPSVQDQRAQAAQQIAAVPDLHQKRLEAGSAAPKDALEAKPGLPPAAAPTVVGGTAARTLDAAQPSPSASDNFDAKSGAALQSATPPPPAAASPMSVPPDRALPPLEQNAAAKSMADRVTVVGESPAAGLVARGAVAAPVEIRSPESPYRWRIIPPAGVQRTTDGGATWAIVDPIATGNRGNRSSVALVAGSSPGRDVCWIVGRAGLVLLSTDGATWHRRPLPETVDATAVRATDATNAIVTTADGRRFATVDGGLSWTPLK